MVGVEGHGLFLVDILAGLDRGHEIQSVLVLRRGDQHCVNTGIVKQPAKIGISLDVRDITLHFIQAARVKIGHRYPFNVGALQRGLENLLAAAAASDKADADAVVRSQYSTGRKQSGCRQDSRAAQRLLHKGTSTRH